MADDSTKNDVSQSNSKKEDSLFSPREIVSGIGSRMLAPGVMAATDVVSTGAFAAQMALCKTKEDKEKMLCSALSKIEKAADKISETVSLPITASVDWIADRLEGKGPTTPVGMAVAEHLESSGVDTRAAQSLAATVEPVLNEHLEKDSAPGDKVVFHASGDAAVTVERGREDNPASSIAFDADTLKAIKDNGMPTQGVAEIRTNLEPGAQQVSDYKIVEHFGHDMVKAVGDQGFPHGEVKATQVAIEASIGEAVPTSTALQALGHAARDMDGSAGTVSIATGASEPIAGPTTSQLREVAGLSAPEGPRLTMAPEERSMSW